MVYVNDIIITSILPSVKSAIRKIQMISATLLSALVVLKIYFFSVGPAIFVDLCNVQAMHRSFFPGKAKFFLIIPLLFQDKEWKREKKSILFYDLRLQFR